MTSDYYIVQIHNNADRDRVRIRLMSGLGATVFDRICTDVDGYKNAIRDLQDFVCDLHVFKPGIEGSTFFKRAMAVTSLGIVPRGSLLRLDVIN